MYRKDFQEAKRLRIARQEAKRPTILFPEYKGGKYVKETQY